MKIQPVASLCALLATVGSRVLVNAQVEMAPLSNRLFPGRFVSADGGCYTEILGATLAEFVIGLCSLSIAARGSTFNVPADIATMLVDLIPQQRVYRFCSKKIYKTGLVRPDADAEFGFSVQNGNDFQLILFLPNVKVVCEGCVFSAAESKSGYPPGFVVAGSIVLPEAEQVPVPGLKADASNLIIEGVTFTQEPEAITYYSMVMFHGQAENVLIKDCTFTGITNSRHAIVTLYQELSDHNTEKPYSSLTVDNCVFKNNELKDTAITSSYQGCFDPPDKDRSTEPGWLRVTGSTFVENTHSRGLIRTVDWPKAILSGNTFCKNSSPGGTPLISVDPDVAGSEVEGVDPNSACPPEDCGFLGLRCVFGGLWGAVWGAVRYLASLVGIAV